MSEEKQIIDPDYLLNNVEALYPKIDRPYKWDQGENRSVPCDAKDDGAAYDINFKMDKDAAVALNKFMKELYNNRKQDGWPEYNSTHPNKQKHPFKEVDGVFTHKAKLNAAYNGQTTTKPVQWDAKLNKLPEDFRLTSGSTVNVFVTGIPYSGSMGAGVSLRLKMVQVIKFVPMQERSPFEEQDGFTFGGDENPFSVVSDSTSTAPDNSDNSDEIDFGEEEEVVEEPKKAVKKSAAPKKGKANIADVLEDWDD